MDERIAQGKKQMAGNIAMAFLQNQQITQALAQQMTQMMQALMQQNQAIMQMLQMPKQSRIIRDPQTGDVVGSEQVPMMPQEEPMPEEQPMVPPQGAGM